ncbi:MAG: hypothetical protein M1827_000404 [Pycnora praestabilis]|nr:MAG: hypothetical protein M1827_000404 [Pycnora praestabilis]
MDNRRDALVGAAKIVLEIQRLGKASETGMATVSLFKTSPQNFGNIPDTVDFSFSMQHTEQAALQKMESDIYAFVKKTAEEDNPELKVMEKIWNFDPACKRLVSLTGHDSVYTRVVCPTAMVFTPCKDGISHNPAEYANPKECSDGAQTILGAVLKYDDILRKKHST